MFIVKPNASSRGRGIRVISHKHEIPRARKCMIQSYLPNPFLVDGYKSDMRCAHDISIQCMLNISHACFYKSDLRVYVLGTSFDPLRLYIHDDGLVRFATEKYPKVRHPSSRNRM